MKRLLGLGALVAVACSPAEPDNGETPASSKAAIKAHAGESASTLEIIFERRFVNVLAESGVDFVHHTGGEGNKFLPEAMGAGAALLDADGDGNLDLYLIDSQAPRAGQDIWPVEGLGPASDLYLGRGACQFTRAPEGDLARVRLRGMGCAVGDVEGDGDPDIYITAVGRNALLRNDRATWKETAREIGVAGGHWRNGDGDEFEEWSTACAFADFDNDGDLDLFVANYVQWTPETEIFTTLDGHSKAFTTPDRYPGLPSRMFVNEGDGTFMDGSEAAGLLTHSGKALGVGLWDFDRDGSMDVVVANDTQPNFYFHNRGNLSFEERGLQSGIAYDENGRARAGMGIDVAELGNDEFDAAVVAIGNFGTEPMSLYHHTGQGFRPIAERVGLALATTTPLTFGVLFADLDLDGHLDLVLANGHLEPEIERFSPAERHAQRPQLFRGSEQGAFSDVSDMAGPGFSETFVGRGLVSGDLDGDGDLDLVLTQNGAAPAILRNDWARDSTSHGSVHWLRIKGLRPGARVELNSFGRTQTRTYRGGSSYLSHSESTLTFGLGAKDDAVTILVQNPDGTTFKRGPLKTNQTLDLAPD